MFCTQCGTKLPDGSKFCTNCGAKMEIKAAPVTAPVEEPVKEEAVPVEEVVKEEAAPVEEPVKEEAAPVEEPIKEEAAEPYEPSVSLAVPPEKPGKKGKGGMIAVVIMLLVVVLAAGAFALWFFVLRDKPIDLFEQALEADDYREASKIYDELEDEDENTADALIIEEIDSLFADYKSGEIESIEELNKRMEKLAKIDSDSDEVEEAFEKAAKKFVLLEQCADSLKYGQEQYDIEDYDSAVRYLVVVIEESPDYDKAQELIKKATEAALEQAKEDADLEYYDSALGIIENVMEAFGENTDNELYEKLESQKESYQKAKDEKYRTDAIDNINSNIENSDFYSAIYYSKEALNNYPDDAEFIELYKKAAEGYVNEYIKYALEDSQFNGNYAPVLEELVELYNDTDDEYIKEAVKGKVTEFEEGFEKLVNRALEARDITKAVMYLGQLGVISDSKAVSGTKDNLAALGESTNWYELSYVTAGEYLSRVDAYVDAQNDRFYENVYKTRIDANSYDQYTGIVISNLGGKYLSFRLRLASILTMSDSVPGTATIDITVDGTSVLHEANVNLSSEEYIADIPLSAGANQVIVRIGLEAPMDGSYTIIEPYILSMVFASQDLCDVTFGEFDLSGEALEFTAGTTQTPEDSENTEAPDGSEGSETPEATQEPTIDTGTVIDGEAATVNVELTSTGDSSVKVIKAIRDFKGIGLAEAKAYTDNTPSIVLESATQEEAQEFKTLLEEAGATVTLK